MGKGDKKSKKGKIRMGSYGNSRKRNTIKLRIRRRLSPDKPVVVAEAAAAVDVVEAKPKVKRTVKKKAEGAE
jgi:ribosomal small subunit protein bTHX